METKAMLTQRASAGCRCGGKKRSPAKRCRNIVTDDPVEKPDLAIYSQLEELANGNVPTWDSPDITTNDWRPFRLMAEAEVTIRNLSATVPAINTLVHYAIAPFGIGTVKVRMLTRVVNVPPNAAVKLLFPLAQSTLNGDPRVGVHMEIEHPHDPTLINNRGSQVHDGGFTSESGRNFSIHVPVYNDANFHREIKLAIMPTDIVASVMPQSHFFAPHEQIMATLNIQVPGFLHGTPAAFLSQSVTLVGRLLNGDLIGGVTRLIRIDD